MNFVMSRKWLLLLLSVGAGLSANSAEAQRVLPTLFREQRSMSIRDPSQLAPARVPESPIPSTVSNPQPDLEPFLLSLDEAIRASLQNMNVVRVLAGITATTSGRTIYDPAVINNNIDQQNAQFDPTLKINNAWNRLENPSSIFDALNPGSSLITGLRTDNFRTSTDLTKVNALGGTWDLGVNATPSRIQPGLFPLNPSTSSSTSLSYTDRKSTRLNSSHG